MRVVVDSSQDRNVFVAMFTGAEGKHVWSRGFGGADGITMGDEGRGIALTPKGELYLTGFFGLEIDFGGGILESNAARRDIFLAKLRR
jgi:hypothetical protein